MLISVNWYEYLLHQVPKGQFWLLGDRHSRGTVLPYQDASYEIDFRGEASHTYKVTLSGVELANMLTDTDGRGVVTLPERLEPGAYEVQIIDPLTADTVRLFYDIRDMATILAAYAKILDGIDDEIMSLENARSLRTADSQYIEPAYGLSVHQGWPSEYPLGDYRTLLKALRPAYRQFGGTHEAIKQAVIAMTSVSPFIVPDAWRSAWVLGENLFPEGELATYSRVCEPMWAPAGAPTELPALNRQSRYWVIPSVTAATTSGFRALPSAQKITITNNSGANTVYATVQGLDENGAAIAERIPPTGTIAINGTQASTLLYTSITSVTPTGTSPDIAVGLADSRFIKVLGLNSFHNVGSVLDLNYRDRVNQHVRLRLGLGPTGTDQDTIVTLRDVGREAKVFGVRTVAANFDFDPAGNTFPVEYHNRLHLRINGAAPVTLPIATSETTAAESVGNVATNINTVYTGGDMDAYDRDGTEGTATDHFLELRSVTVPDPNAGVESSIEVLPGPADAAPFILGLPKSTSPVVSFPSATEVTVENSQNMPAADFDIRIRGLQQGRTVCVLTVGADPTRAIITGLVNADIVVGGYIRWQDTTVVPGPHTTNDGLHRVIGFSSGDPIVLHESGADDFDGTVSGPLLQAAGYASYFHPGVIYTVTSNDTATDTLTIESGDLTLWTAALKPIVDTVILSPYRVEGVEGPGTIEVEVDQEYRPYHDYGDSITWISGSTYELECLRADFTGLTGTLNIRGTEFESNTGAFAISSVPTSTTIRFTNAAGPGSALTDEASDSIEWWHDKVGLANVDDNITVEGPDTPDKLIQLDDCTLTVLTDHEALADAHAGEVGPSVMWFESTDASSTLVFSVPRLLEFRGLPITVNAWVQEGYGAARTYEILYDGNVVAFDTAPIMPVHFGTSPPVHPLDPTCVSGTFYLPYDATSTELRVTRTGVGAAEAFALEKFTVVAMNTQSSALGGTGYTLGEETIARTSKREVFGSLLYAWAARPLSDEEKGFLGFVDGDSIATTLGHVDRVTANHAYWDRLEITEYNPADSYTPENVRGFYTDTELDQCTLVNLDVVMGTPSRLSYVRPSQATLAEGEALTMVDGGDGYPAAARATLTEDSCHQSTYPQAPNTDVGSKSRLYEVKPSDYSYRNPDGKYTIIPAGYPIPLPDTEDEATVQPWEFTAADEIRVNSPYFDVDSSYVLDYDRLMQITTPAFELDPGSGIVVEDYVWLADLAIYTRKQTEIHTVREEVGLDFFGDFTARLSRHADTTGIATMYQDDGIEKKKVSSSQWVFVDTRRVKINAGTFNPQYVYSLEYDMAIPNPARVAGVKFEWRWAETELDVANATWEEIEDGQPLSPVVLATPDLTVNSPPPWLQMRVTISDVTTPDDIRIYGLGVKGLPIS